ncbi:MAG: hypothetical protein HYS81_04675 [Candidatus Aenigmatarchaeota archaeon]|nr:MAG: hypothetical protein HYS81_04675 [Candidatus Aenigmarchaeota archaeon]
MVNEGGLLNGLMLVAASFIFLLSVYLEHRRWKDLLSSSAMGISTVFWTLAGALTFFMGARQIAAYFGAYGIDKTFFLAAGIPGSIIAAPVIGLLVFTLTGDRKRTLLAELAVALLALWSVILAAQEGFVGPHVTYWGTQYDLVSGLAKIVIMAGLLLPGVIGSAALLWMSRYSQSPRIGRSLFLSSLSMLVFMASVSLDTIIGGSSGELILLFRLLVVASAVLAFRAYAVE